MRNSNYTSPGAASSTDRCADCGQTDYIILEEGQHLAKRCRNCGKWARWVPHTAENLALCEKPSAPKIAPTLFAVSDSRAKIQEPARPATAPCDHGRQLDLLIESLNCCNRHLSIVTRALMGQPTR